jgi:hypothetical protein
MSDFIAQTLEEREEGQEIQNTKNPETDPEEHVNPVIIINELREKLNRERNDFQTQMSLLIRLRKLLSRTRTGIS